MALGERLVVRDPLPGTLLAHLTEAQRIFASWYRHLSVIDIEAPEEPCPDPPAAGALSFFSGGVDSFATALRHRERLSGLLLVQGFDVRLTDAELWSETVSRLQSSADGLGLPLVTVSTNARAFLDRAGDWGEVAHGAGLASVGHLFTGRVGTILIPSTHMLRDLFPWGSHPLVDPLWSSESLRFVHDAAHLTRVEKTALVADSPVALAHLRVCFQRTQGAYNCGRCEKCIRTMIGLELVGGLSRCPTFPAALLPTVLPLLRITASNSASFARENLEWAERQGRTDIAERLREALWTYEAREAAGDLVRVLRGLRWKYVRRRLGW
jgi:hypothetical protein